jgi:hypothetical protein
VIGAYRATLVRFLEVETATPPLDLYLNKWVADFEQRLECTGKGALIRGIPYNLAYSTPLWYSYPWLIVPPLAEGRCPDILLAYSTPLN